MAFDLAAFMERELPLVTQRTQSAASRAVRTVPGVTREPGEQVIYGDTPFEPAGGAPSKRANKNRSGRAGRKSHNGRMTLARVGGSADLMGAMYAPADKELCKVVDPRTGFRDGVPFRSPSR